MKNYRNKNIIKIIAMLCIASLLFTSCTATLPDLGNAVISAYSGDTYHKTNASAYKTISKSGLIELLFDKNTATIAVRDTNSKKVWTTLPSEKTSGEIQSSALEITLSNSKGEIYTLNSQDNSVAYGNFKYTASADGVSVTYSMALSKESGEKDIANAEKDEIRADITIFYTLRDGSFYTNVSMNNVHLPENVRLERVKVLEHFGAYENSGAEDYLFVPDGSGAIIKTGVEDKEFEPLTLTVYEKNQCLLGAFGIRHNESAFLCIIEQGDSVAQINANRKDEKSLNSVNASFNINNEYKNEIVLCYRFLSGKSATYSGMATACRENLIRNSVLSTKTVDTTNEQIPMVVTLQGGYRTEKGKYIKLTDYKQALSLMSLLKAKGVNNIYLRYNGLYDNANNGNTDDFDDFRKSLGSKKEFNELYTYLNSQKFALFIDTDILTYKYGIDGAKTREAKNYTDDKIGDFPNFTKKQGFLKLSKLEDKIEDILSASENVNFDGYALNDIGAYLYEDFSHDSYTRSYAQSEISAQVPVLATSKKLMIDNGNFYSVKSADVISNIPISPLSRSESNAYVGIPFIQMLLHGIYEYSTADANGAENMQVAFLNAIEYGCLPSATWYCTLYQKDLDDKYYYDSNINDMVSYYNKANTALSGLRDARMTSHEEVQNGVYCTEYDNSIKVYVNYTDKSVTVNGITVNAMDCITIS